MLSAMANARLICEEKTGLLLEYQRTTGTYAAAVSELVRQMGVVQKTEYDRLNQIAEQARHVSADARDRLERHIAQHDC
jgi:hypothetical protein